MEAVESFSKTLVRDKSLATDSAKSLDPEAKTLQGTEKAAALSVSMDKTWGNGVGVLLNGKGVGGGCTGVVAGESDQTKSVETETTELEKESLEDSEMNGVSSLLKMRASAREIDKYGVAADGGKPAKGFGSAFVVVDRDKEQGVEHDEPSSGICGVDGVLYDVHVHGERQKVNGQVVGSFGPWSKDGGVVKEIDEELHQISQDMGEESDEEADGGGDYEFSVGDYIWSKIKSHPWWPGRVYDPSDASEFAMKKRQKTRLLVAYFGDNSFSWCHASQLKPFEENFEDLSKLSQSRNCLAAVQEAVNEMERLVELNLTCSCVQKRTGSALEWPKASSAGIKKGVCVPGGGVGLLEPTDVINKLKLFAKTVSSSNLLDCAVLKGWLSAFYGSKGFSHLPMHHQPLPILGLEDPTETSVADMSNYSNFADTPVQGPAEDMLLHPPEGTIQHLSDSHPDGLDDTMHHSRKHKSIAEILEVAKSAQTARRKSKAQRGTKLDEVAVSSPSTLRSKRKRINGANGDGDRNSGSTETMSKRTRSSGSITAMKGQTSDIETDGNATKEETVKARSKRKSKDGSLNDASGQEKDNISGFSMFTRKKGEIHVSLGVARDDDENKKQIEGTSSPRERKKSKYLSPPYTTSNARQKKSDMESEALAVLAETQLGERTTEAAGHLLGSPQFMKQCDYPEKKQPAELVVGHDAANESSLHTPKECQSSVIDLMKVDAPVHQVISSIRSAATSPQYSKHNFSNYSTGEFLSVFRDSVYRNGCYYKEYNKRQPRKKLKSSKSGADVTKKEQNQATTDSSKSKSQQANTGDNAEAKSSKRKIKQVSRTGYKQTTGGEVSNRPKTKSAIKTPLKSNDEDSDEEASPAVLFVSFGPGSSLPSKVDLIKIFSKYGSLNRHYTDMFISNFCARIVFKKSSDAEKAFSASQIVSPFGATNVTLQLRYLTASSDLCELRDLPSAKAASAANERVKIPGNTSDLQQAADKSPEINYVRHKLEMLTAMLATSGERMSSRMKSKLQVELKGLLEKVSTIAAA